MLFGSPNNYPIPSRFSVTEDTNGFSISWRWFSFKYIAILIFCFFWFGFLGVLYFSAIQTPGTDESTRLIILLAPLVHVLVGLGLLYSAICGFFNTTQITIHNGTLSVRHFPLPWWGNLTITTTEIRQLYVTQHSRRTKHGTRIFYQVNILNLTGHTKKLISNLDEQSAQFLEHALEKQMKIANQNVPGEHFSDSSR